MSSLLFSSFHNDLDPTSGAAISTRETLLALVRNGKDSSTTERN